MPEKTRPVLHAPSEHRFYLSFPDQKDAELQYEEKGQGILDFRSTFVPEPKRHEGIGSRLVEAGLRYADEHENQVIATCPFVDHFLANHPAYQHLQV